MKGRWILIGAILGLFLGCKNEERAVVLEPTDSTIRYELPKVEFVKQLDIAEDITDRWSVFNEYRVILASIPNSTLERIRTQSERLMSYSDSLIKHVPKELATMPIKTRLDVVHARMSLLKQSSENLIVDSVELKNNFEESVTSFNILLHQINEKFEKDAILKTEEGNFSSEMQQRFRDSIFQIEKSRSK